jgi:hypothetical protein
VDHQGVRPSEGLERGRDGVGKEERGNHAQSVPPRRYGVAG